MIHIDDTLVSLDLLEKKFICDLHACKGQCCVDGDAGAPLTEEEAKIIQEIYPKVIPFMQKAGVEAIEKQGTSVIDEDDNELVTPLIDGKECAYSYFDEEGICFCAIEKAYNEKLISFHKPSSCHLYPVRLAYFEAYTAVNYNKWSVCSAAVVLGEKKGVPVYQFLKQPLINRFGQEWYNQLDAVANEYLGVK